MNKRLNEMHAEQIGEDFGAYASAKEVRRVVALSYDPEDGPPRIVYKAVGVDAETVLLANRSRYGIKVVKNEALTRRLFRLPIQGEIGVELYGLVAQILVHVFEVEAGIVRNSNSLRSTYSELANPLTPNPSPACGRGESC